MWLFLWFIFLNSFFNYVSAFSIFVKISWRENDENNEDYYKSLAGEDYERFKLELTGLYLDNPIIGLTDINDTFHFADQNIYGDNFNLKITICGLNNIGCKDMYNSNFVANFNNIETDEGGSGQYKSTNYVKTFICPDDEYTLMVEHK
uniref:Uncharacterized protein n=1 Tax=Meloidogyne floridensis TaxID=298350 RepID=A0A915NIV2_9BILA